MQGLLKWGFPCSSHRSLKWHINTVKPEIYETSKLRKKHLHCIRLISFTVSYLYRKYISLLKWSMTVANIWTHTLSKFDSIKLTHHSAIKWLFKGAALQFPHPFPDFQTILHKKYIYQSHIINYWTACSANTHRIFCRRVWDSKFESNKLRF